MGDYASPKRRDLYDRLRRRFELYRRRHLGSAGRYERIASNLYETQRQDSQLLQQRWLESKAKKSKNSRSHSANAANTAANANSGNLGTSGNSGDRTNTQLVKKRKLDHDLNNPGTTVDQIYKFDDNKDDQSQQQTGAAPGNHPDNGASCLHSQVSVNIIQQINTQGDLQGNQKIKLTVSSTVHTGNNNNNNKASTDTNVSQTSTIETSANICKQEPQDSDTLTSTPSGQPQGSYDPIGEVGDELDLFLSQLSPGVFKELMDNAGPLGQDGTTTSDSNNAANQDLMPSDLKQFSDAVQSSVGQAQQHTTQATLGIKDNQAATTGSKRGRERKDSHCSTPGGAMYGDTLSTASSPTAAQQSFPGGIQGQGVMPMGYSRPQSGPPGPGTSPGIGGAIPPPLLGDTGPAAETLKQMAAQHQQFGSKDNNHQNDNLLEGYRHRNQYPYPYNGGPQGMYNYQNGSAPVPPHIARPDSSGSYQGHVMPKMEPGMNYGSTKPLSHYPSAPTSAASTVAPSSSLQQLQNQVHSQFSTANGTNYSHQTREGGVHIKQSQQMHMTASSGNGNSGSSGGMAGSGPSTGAGASSQAMHVSQTQQMHIQTGGPSSQQISVAQQQSFSMSQGPAGQQASQQSQASTQQPQPQPQQQQQQQQQPQQQSQQQAPQQQGHTTDSSKAGFMSGQSSGTPQGDAGNMFPAGAASGLDKAQQPMRQYMNHAPPNHPPPEYKAPVNTPTPTMAGPGFSGPNGSASSQRDSSNPLQTMQNMVNETSQPTPPAVSAQEMMYRERMVKSEHMAGHVQNGPMMNPHQGMGPMGPGQRSSPGAATGVRPPSNHGNMNMVGSRPTPPYPMAQQAGMANGTASTKGGKPDTPMYTSAIMRGQRPPNVNVGPDGLNISHQRNPAEWPRPMMGSHHGMGIPGPNYPAGMRPVMGPQGMMQYPPGYQGGYPGGMNMGGPGMDHPHHMQMSQQQAMMMAHQQRMPHPHHGQQRHMMAGPMGGPPAHMMGPGHHQPSHMPHGTGPMPPGMHMAQHQQMSMQHNGQAMAMNQSAVSSHHMPPQARGGAQQAPAGFPSGSQAAPGANPAPTQAPQQQGGPNNNPSGPPFALDFLDNPSSNNTDFFDSVVQNTNPSDFNNFIDDILGSGK